MHYVRFLKGPSLRTASLPSSKSKAESKPKQRASVNTATSSVYALVTLETDLGDNIYYGDVELTCTVLVATPDINTNLSTSLSRGKAQSIVSPSSHIIASLNITWSSGARTLAVEVPLPSGAVKGKAPALRLRVVAKNADGARIRDGVLVMPVVIPQTAAVIVQDAASVDGKRQVERPLALGTSGSELVIWEDAGVSMARHVW